MKPIIDLSSVTLPLPLPKAKRVSAKVREIESLWDSYQTKRDFICSQHAGYLKIGERSPKLIFLFATLDKYRWRTYRMPAFIYPRKSIEWLRKLNKHCDYVIRYPNGTSYDTNS